KALGIEAQKEGMKGPWLWRLPSKMLNNPEDVQAEVVSTFGGNEHLRQDDGPIYPDNGGVPEFTEDDLQTAGWV
uniref:hypothetical protein n=1 Tax=Geobacter sp. TaxID=46610 RepID=UPI0027B9C9B5